MRYTARMVVPACEPTPAGLPYRRRLSPLQIGDRSIWPPLIQAPMAAMTTAAVRSLAEDHGCGFTVTELVPVEWLVTKNARASERMQRSRSSRPFAVQLHGANVEQMYVAASMAAAAGADLIDLNMGCPNRQVIKGRRGAALMRYPKLAGELVQAAGEGGGPQIPITVKIRSGWDDKHINAPEFAQQMVASGAVAVTVHGRTRAQRYDGCADHRVVALVKQAVAVPVIVNGDIDGEKSLEQALRASGADGAMVGRAALGNPWIFARLKAWCEGAPIPPGPSQVQRVAMMLRHLRLHLATGSTQWRAVVEMRKFAPFYLGPLPDGAELRHQINRLDDIDQIEDLLWRRERSPCSGSSC